MKWISLIFIFICTSVYAHPGIGIVMDSKGNIFYTDLKQVWKIDTQGKKSVAVPGVHTHELFMDEQDNLFGEHLWYNGERLDTWGHYVWRLSASGKIEKIIPDTEGFLTNYSFVRDKQGNMYWADRDDTCQKVIKKNKDESTVRLGNTCFENIRWITSTDTGIIYLVDHNALKKIDKNGNVTTISAGIHDRSWTQLMVSDNHAIMGITVDAQQNIYASVYSGKVVKKISPSGSVVTVSKTSTPWSPTATLVGRDGDFWILENSITNSVRVERITKDGRRIIY